MAHTIPITAGRGRRARSRRLLALVGDASLVAEIRAGNEAAFEIVYSRFGSAILSFCRHMLGSPEEAEDAVQHTFAAAYGDLLRSEREVHLKPWLYTIARNRCLSVLRSRREQPGERIEVATHGLHECVQERADLRDLLADLRDLPERQRAALLLCELRDLSHAEVAEVLGCEPARVKGIVFRARSGLIERREARDAACSDIRAELASAHRGALRRGRLRHHLKTCAGCTAYLEEVRRQRRMLALLLPVVPSVGLKRAALGAAGIGASSAGGGVAGGGLAASLGAATVAKVVAVGVLAGGVGLAGERALDGGLGDRAAPAPAPSEAATPGPPSRPTSSSGAGAGARTPGGREAGPGRRSSRLLRGRKRAGGQAAGRGKSATAPGHRVPRPANGRPEAPPGRSRSSAPTSRSKSGQAPGTAKGLKTRARGTPRARSPGFLPRSARVAGSPRVRSARLSP